MRPGDFVDASDVESAVRSLAIETGLGADAILRSRFGYPPIPAPPPGSREGGGRLPPGLEPAMARHPVFWLERPTRLRRRNEADETFALRLYLELAARDFVEHTSGRWRDALALAGIDAASRAGAHRVAAYRDGAADEALDALVIPLGDAALLPEGWAAVETRRLLRVLSRDHHAVVEAHEAMAPDAADAAFEAIQLVDAREPVERLRQAVAARSVSMSRAAVADALAVLGRMWDDLEVVWTVVRPPGHARPDPGVAAARPSWAESPGGFAQQLAEDACLSERGLRDAVDFLINQFERVSGEATRVADLVESLKADALPDPPLTVFTREPIPAPEWVATVAGEMTRPPNHGRAGSDAAP